MTLNNWNRVGELSLQAFGNSDLFMLHQGNSSQILAHTGAFTALQKCPLGIGNVKC